MKRSLRSWLWQVPLNQEVEEELSFHVEMRIRELIERGVDPKDAREIAVARLGNVARLKRTCVDLGRKRDREMRLTQWLEEFRDDVKFAIRQLKASPAFTIVAALTLALGVGANSAIFALADATLIRPLAFPAPERLVLLSERYRNGVQGAVSPLDFVDWSEQNRTFDALAAVLYGGRAMMGPDGVAEQIPSQTVSHRFFDVLGVRPIAGRTFLPSDEKSDPAVVVLSEAFWRTRLSGDPSLIGREIRLDGRPTTVIGVVPAGAQMSPPALEGVAAVQPASLWTVMNPIPRNPSQRRPHYFQVIGRLKPGVTLDAAQSDMTAIAETLAREWPATNDGHGVAVDPLREVLIGREVRLTSTLLLGVVAFVLLLCCANVANLLLARTTVRAREMAVRSALGAGRRRIVAQLLTEGLILASLGGLIGSALGAAILQVAPTLIPPGLLPGVVTLQFDARVLTFCAAASVLVGIVFGLVPAWQGTGVSLVQAISSDSRGSTRRGSRVRGIVVVGEVAAAVLLLCGAGLLLRTLVNLADVDPGYRSREVLTMQVNLMNRYPMPDSWRRFYEAVEQEVASAPGVQRVAWGAALPLDGIWFGQAFQIAGDPVKTAANPDWASYHMVTPSYFETLGISVLAGRPFDSRDVATGAQVVIVNEAFVRRYLGGRQPLGMRLAVPRMTQIPEEPPVREIVGVVRQVKGRPNESEPQPHLYVPLAQNSWWMASLVVQPIDGPAETLTSSVRAAIARINNDLPVTRVRTMSDITWESTSRWRFRAVLVASFAVLALAMAMIGVFGVLVYSVQQRTREFGVRMALGATVSDVMRLVVTSAARVTLVGVAIGLAAAALFSRWIATLLFGVQPLDAMTFAAASIVLGVTAAVATAAPALRAARVDPVVTFRSE